MALSDRFLLVDGHGLAFRAFYALPALSAPDGTPVNAVLGFLNMLYKVLEDQRPTGWAIFFDPPGPVIRREVLESYKAGRRPTPQEFKVQLPIIIDLLEALGHPVHVREGQEADDVIAATAVNLSGSGEVVILSADKDLLQVISPSVKVCRPVKGVSEFRVYDQEAFLEEYRFPPALMADYLALTGDSVDNIPGVPGIGDKGARELVSSLGPLESIYEALDRLSSAKRKRLEEGRDLAFLSRQLVLPVPTESLDVRDLVPREAQRGRALRILEGLAMRQLIQRLGLDGADRGAGVEVSSTGGAVESSLEDLLASGTLALVGRWEELQRGSSELALWDKAGGLWRGAVDLDRLRRILEAFGDRELLLWDQKGLISALGDLPRGCSVMDLKLCYYGLHPDRTAVMGRDLVSGALSGQWNPWTLWDQIRSDPLWEGVRELVTRVDHPLSAVLVDMEREGIGLDVEGLRGLRERLEGALGALEEGIAREAGAQVNLQSPKQVAWLLFERLGLPPVKRTKTGLSTDVGVLEELSRLPEPLGRVPSMILEHREISKLITAFVNPFLEQGSSGVIRSTFDQTGTGTGRLSSRDPNVQNLPQFGHWAVEFRRCLVPVEEGNVFVSADYSQIELRVLAHLSGEERLIRAFEEGADVHARTASWIYGVDPQAVSPEQRRFAKVVNFGLLYGMGAHGLAQRMGVSRSEAAEVMERYFSALPGVREFTRRMVEQAKARGYAATLMGRVRPLSEVSTVEGRGAGAIDRVAINTPIQGSAADIARKAMVELHRALAGGDCRMVLQVHDSIVCSVPEGMASRVAELMREVMEGAASLSVPLVVEVKTGGTLGDL